MSISCRTLLSAACVSVAALIGSSAAFACTPVEPSPPTPEVAGSGSPVPTLPPATVTTPAAAAPAPAAAPAAAPAETASAVHLAPYPSPAPVSASSPVVERATASRSTPPAVRRTATPPATLPARLAPAPATASGDLGSAFQTPTALAAPYPSVVGGASETPSSNLSHSLVLVDLGAVVVTCAAIAAIRRRRVASMSS